MAGRGWRGQCSEQRANQGTCTPESGNVNRANQETNETAPIEKQCLTRLPHQSGNTKQIRRRYHPDFEAVPILYYHPDLETVPTQYTSTLRKPWSERHGAVDCQFTFWVNAVGQLLFWDIPPLPYRDM